MTPTWFQHPDLMNAIIIIFGLIIAWFVRRDFSRFSDKLDAICKEKADRTKVEKEQNLMWKRINTHGHNIECPAPSCKPKTTAVLLHDDGSAAS